MNRARRAPIVVLLLIALIATGFTRTLADHKRTAGQPLGSMGASAGGSQLSRMNSFALALLLGGLRGPLVMILWTSSESQKTEKNLEDFDTKVEWIRMLQPEFDTVHIFQIWNKAYNISVQMASLANKYRTIIDAIDYARRVDQERPNNVNILYAIGSVYGDKLGDSAEKAYYTKRVREESLPHAVRQKLAQDDPGYRRLQLDAVLDADGKVLPQYLKPTNIKPLVDPTRGEDVYDGSELPYLKKFEPYRYGVSPFGFAYNYRKRAQLLERLSSQRHAQLSDLVIDSRPALDLKKWGETEWEISRRAEIQGMSMAAPAERDQLEQVSADVAPDVTIDPSKRALLEQAVFGYDLASRVWREAEIEYARHLDRDKTNFQTYESHREELAANLELVQGDRDYLAATLEPADRKPALLASAREHYRHALVRYAMLSIHYYIPDDVAVHTLPDKVTRATMSATWIAKADQLTPEEVVPVLNRSMQLMQANHWPLSEEINEYLGYMRRAQARLSHLPK
jgi:hypothetical protein